MNIERFEATGFPAYLLGRALSRYERARVSVSILRCGRWYYCAVWEGEWRSSTSLARGQERYRLRVRYDDPTDIQLTRSRYERRMNRPDRWSEPVLVANGNGWLTGSIIFDRFAATLCNAPPMATVYMDGAGWGRPDPRPVPKKPRKSRLQRAKERQARRREVT
jgi:hypothetical protein